jgi:hypothetical protein
MVLDMAPYTDDYLAAMEEFRDAAHAGGGMVHPSSARGACVRACVRV